MKKLPAMKIKTVEEYLSKLDPITRDLLIIVRDLVKKAAPEATEVISYSIPAFKLNGKNLIYFAAWKEHISIYPIPRGDEAFQKAISTYQGGKGTLKFAINKKLPVTLIKKIIKFHLQENIEREKKSAAIKKKKVK